jgi:hypothetical protein
VVDVNALAVDAPEQIVEAVTWLDSLDIVLLDALANGSYSLAEAAEYALVGHGRIRSRLGAALLAVA